MNEIDTMSIIEVLFGGGILVTFITWAASKLKKAGMDETMSKLLTEEVQKIKEEQVAQAEAIRTLEKCVNKIDLDMSVEIMAIKKDILHIKELQKAQSENLALIATGINKLLAK